MSNLRIIGFLVGVFGLFLTFIVFRGQKWEKRNFVLFGVFSVSLMILSVYPGLLNDVAEILKLERRQRGRILFLSIVSNILLWYGLIYLKSRFDRYRYQFDLLIRSLGRERERAVSELQLKSKEIVIIIPAYNEAENLETLLPTIPKEINGKQLGVLVVDDGSTDETTQVVKKAGYLVVSNKVTRGGGAALRLGYDIIQDIKPEIVVTMDADGQHDPQEIECIVGPILENKSDLVIGSRVLGWREKDNKVRFLGLHVFNFTINLLMGTKITDCSSGFRAFRADLLDSVSLREDQYHTSELIIDAVRKGARIGEVPVSISKRVYGKSKKGKDWEYGINFAKTIIRTWWR